MLPMLRGLPSHPLHHVTLHQQESISQTDRQTDKSLATLTWEDIATLSLKLSVASTYSSRMCTTHFSDSRGVSLLIPYPGHDFTFKLSINHPSPLHIASTVPTQANQHKMYQTQTNINVKTRKNNLSLDMK